jgi:hypothetical protein
VWIGGEEKKGTNVVPDDELAAMWQTCVFKKDSIDFVVVVGRWGL